MEKKTIDDLAENLFPIFYVIHKKLLSMDLRCLPGNVSRLHLAIMGMLGEESLPVSEIARRLAIPKPQMTHLSDQLVNLGIVERRPDVEDRRVTNILLTDRGKIVFDECKEMARRNMKNKLACLTPAEREDLLSALEKLKNIGAKL
ncbi:MAG: MarR family transcriptional regulator [Dehalococcoidia bacterium]|nr:MarR family transcriptional regulator [Dehalococcoidia bacterium]